MPIEITEDDISHLIERSKAGEPFKDIAKSVGICDRTLMVWFHKRGFKHRQYTNEKRAAVVAPLYAAHAAGESVLALSIRTGLDRDYICQGFKELGFRQKTMKEAQVTRSGQETIAQKKSRVAGANIAARGRVASHGERLLKAASRSRRVGMYEREIIEELSARGVKCEGQYPLGTYNLDIFIHECSIAVEVYSAHPSKKLMAGIHKRTEYILNTGANQATIQVSYPGRSFDLMAVCDQLVAYLDFCRRNKAAIGHHGVIRGHGQLSTASSHQSNDRPLISSL